MPSIKIYSTPTCPHCKMAKQFLNDNKIAFENIDVSTDEKAAQEMIDKSGQMGVPVFEIDGKIVIGFNKAELTKILELGA